MGLYNVIYKLFARPVRGLWRIRTEGLENVPESGGFILVSNHTAFSDVIVLEAAQTRQICFMAKRELFRIPLLAQLIRALGAYPVDRGGADVKSIKHTIKMLDNGNVIGIFPQGTRCPNTDPRETDLKSGVGMIAYHAKADVLPVYIDGNGKTRAFHRNTVKIGRLIKFDELGLERSGRAEYERAGKYIFSKVCELKYGSTSEDENVTDQNS